MKKKPLALSIQERLLFAGWKRNPMFCARFAETKRVANIMEWPHVTAAEDFSKGAFVV